MQNSFYKIENEHSNLNVKDEKPVLSQNIKLIEPKNIPSILKRSQNAANPPILITENMNGRKIALSPLPQSNGVTDLHRVSILIKIKEYILNSFK